ncbi:hypothetical protein J5X07_03420 [Actinomyces bowdenii]|uniref:DUF6049 family protein n=1 Tax=Actinomyces bowdenii TaxID=131109 RepID=UPI001ABC7F6F|nr:DUF6049 family protein [Actinomyces bowdenii]MBO3724092.1 hypothetical protein [Actinomyces bowdenii]
MRLLSHRPRRAVPMRAMARLAALLGVLSLVLAFAALPRDAAPGVRGAEPTGTQMRPAGEPAATSTRDRPEPAGAQAEPVAGQVTLSLEALSPEVLRSGSELSVSGTIINGTDDPISGLSLATQVQERTEITTSALSLWLAEERDTSLSQAVETPLDQEIAPGQRAAFSVTLSTEELPLSEPDQWGPRGIQVALNGGGATIAQDRSILVWDSGASVEPAAITTVVPVTASPEELAVLTLPEAQGSETGVSIHTIRQRVTSLLELADSGVVLAVDPALTQALGIDASSFQGTLSGTAPVSPTASPPAPSPPPEGGGAEAGAGPTGGAPDPASTASPAPGPSPTASGQEDPGQGGQSADEIAELTAALTRAIANGEVIALPWDDVDVAAMAHTGGTALVSSAHERAQSSTLAGAGARTTVSWAASSQLDAATLEALPESTTTVIAPPGSMPAAEDLTYTPSGVASIGDRTIILPDEGLSLAASGRLPEDLASPEAQELSDLDARQLLRGQTAIITRQAPVLARSLVVTLDRQAGAALDAETVEARLNALRDTPWTSTRSLGDVAGLMDRARRDGGEEAVVERLAPPEEEVIDQGEASRSTVMQARQAGRRLDSIASVLSHPAAALGRSDDVESVISSASWRAAPQARSTHIDRALAAGETVTSSLSAAPSSTINIINSEAVLPVRITSSLDQDATVQVRLISDSQRLQIPSTTVVEVPAGSEATAKMPVTAVGSGEVNLTVQVLAADGTPVGAPSTVHLQVRADWESVGTAIIGIALVLILVVGVVRTVRRGRRTALPPAAQEPA